MEVGDANAAHSPLPLAFGMMIAVGASLLVFCMFSLPNGSSELAHSLRYAFRGNRLRRDGTVDCTTRCDERCARIMIGETFD